MIGFRRFASEQVPHLRYLTENIYVYGAIRTCQMDSASNLSIISKIEDVIVDLDRYIDNDLNLLSSSYDVRIETYSRHGDSFLILVEPHEHAAFAGLDPKLHRKKRIIIDGPVDPKEAYGQLEKRPDAASILASARNSDTPAAKLVQYIRLFEAAFNLSHNKLRKPLHRFLGSGGHGFTKADSDAWIEIRHGVSHADRPNRVLFDGDALGYIPQLKQAAYDVALNKETWNDPTTGRRPNKSLILTIGSNSSINALKQTGSWSEINNKHSRARLYTSDFFGRRNLLPSETSKKIIFNKESLILEMIKMHETNYTATFDEFCFNII